MKPALSNRPEEEGDAKLIHKTEFVLLSSESDVLRMHCQCLETV